MQQAILSWAVSDDDLTHQAVRLTCTTLHAAAPPLWATLPQKSHFGEGRRTAATQNRAAKHAYRSQRAVAQAQGLPLPPRPRTVTFPLLRQSNRVTLSPPVRRHEHLKFRDFRHGVRFCEQHPAADPVWTQIRVIEVVYCDDSLQTDLAGASSSADLGHRFFRHLSEAFRDRVGVRHGLRWVHITLTRHLHRHLGAPGT